MSSSNNEVVLITGANTGLGLETVKALYSSDKAYTIILSGRSVEKVHQAVIKVDEISPESKSTIDGLELDVAKDESIDAAFEYVKKKYGKLDVLVNNAGKLSPALTERCMCMLALANVSSIRGIL